MSGRVIAAIDQGSSSTRCLLIDEGGNVVHQAGRAHRSAYPQPGWVEEPAEEIAGHVLETLEEAVATSRSIAGIGITNQRETTVVWDRSTGKPVYPAISWQDTRTEGRCRDLIRQGMAPVIAAKTGLPVFPYFSAT